LHAECDDLSKTAADEQFPVKGLVSTTSVAVMECSNDSDYVPDSQSSEASLSPIIPLTKVSAGKKTAKKRKLLFTADKSAKVQVTSSAAEADSDASPDYEPDSDGSSDEVVNQADIRKKSKAKSSAESQDNSAKTASMGNLTVTTPVRSTSSITVMPTGNSADGRVYDKRYYCLYCDKPLAKLCPHLVTQHSNETYVAEMLSKDKHSQKKSLIKLRNLGNHKHNCDVIRSGTGELIVAYRPRQCAAFNENYVPCPNCYGYYETAQLWKHCKKRCPFSTKDSERPNVVSRARLLLPVSENIRQETRTVLSNMHVDDVYRAAVGDELIMQYAQKLTLKHYADMDKHEYIRSKVREIGRLLLVLKSEHNIQAILEAIKPANFNVLLQCVRKVSGFSESTCTYMTPSLALKLGHSMKKCAMMAKSKGIQESNHEMQCNADAFIQLCEIEWSSEISDAALKTMHANKMNKVTVLPLPRDISKLSSYLTNVVQNSVEQLNSTQVDDCQTVWLNLAEASLAQIVMFNRRHSGEVSKMKVSTYNDAASLSQHSDSDVHQNLSPLEQKMCAMLSRVEIPGKRGSTVPVLLTCKFKEALDCLITNRSRCNILPNNEYVFARTSSMSHIRGSDVLRKYAVACEAEAPDTLRSTKLRKHIATISQVINLKDNELDLLAQFLGHNIKVHREYYRLPHDILQASKVAKILLAMETGQQEKLYGSALDDVNVDLEEGNLLNF